MCYSLYGQLTSFKTTLFATNDLRVKPNVDVLVAALAIGSHNTRNVIIGWPWIFTTEQWHRRGSATTTTASFSGDYNAAHALTPARGRMGPDGVYDEEV
ncbi:hypothetical protein MKZ38_007225 [Zalerion maritima]|uniref:Uncharacterized protein n=1 Tax=Zalerion maritima TaxID=339359 RepID=A0AAD5WP89_9PEZI|nr:hypothetical protein MKZ38_007225 [Zalerion maritima]